MGVFDRRQNADRKKTDTMLSTRDKGKYALNREAYFQTAKMQRLQPRAVETEW